MRGQDGVEAKGLRGLRAAKPGAVLRARDQTRLAAPQRIGHRQRRGGGGVHGPAPPAAARSARAETSGRAPSWISTRRHARCPPAPPAHCARFAPASRPPSPAAPPGPAPRPGRGRRGGSPAPPRMPAKAASVWASTGRPARLCHCLGMIAARAGAASCGDDDGGSGHAGVLRLASLCLGQAAEPDNLARKRAACCLIIVHCLIFSHNRRARASGWPSPGLPPRLSLLRRERNWPLPALTLWPRDLSTRPCCWPRWPGSPTCRSAALSARFGAGLVVSEMVASEEVVRAQPEARARAELGFGEVATSVQLAGRDPALDGRGARNGAKGRARGSSTSTWAARRNG